MHRLLAATTLFALALLGSACGQSNVETGAGGTALVNATPGGGADATGTNSTTSTTITSTTATETEPVAPTTQTAVTAASLGQASWDHRFVAIYGNYATESTSAIRYLAASSNDISDLIDDSWTDIRFELPFGVKVTDGQLDISEGPNRPAPTVLWPVECLGVTPDIDGDALLDDCDPYPTDGPLADWDDDGIVNPDDNCPTVSNPDQTVIYERSSGAVCDGREGIGPDVWVVEATITLEDWNQVRAERGLEPLSMPTEPAPLPPDVAAWCAAQSDDDGEATIESLRALASEIPDAYGLTPEQQRRLADLSLELSDLFNQYELMQSDPGAVAGSPEEVSLQFIQVEQQIRGVRGQLAPYVAPLVDSELACHLDR